MTINNLTNITRELLNYYTEQKNIQITLHDTAKRRVCGIIAECALNYIAINNEIVKQPELFSIAFVDKTLQLYIVGLITLDDIIKADVKMNNR